MTSAVNAPSHLQVLPQSIQFDDVSTEQQLQTTVTVKVKLCSLLVVRLSSQRQLTEALRFTHPVVLVFRRTWIADSAYCDGSRRSRSCSRCKAWQRFPSWHLAFSLASR